jgi:HPt (histidine-containing phosphotransfer) domain-containing protein
MSVDSETQGAIIDVDGTLARFGGDKELFVEMTGMLLEDMPSVLAALRNAVNEKNAAAVRMQAHALRGLVAGCGGVRAARSAQTLEDAGHTGNLDSAAVSLATLESEIQLLTQALGAYQT